MRDCRYSQYYLTNEQGEQLGDGTYIGKTVVISEKDERTISLLDILPIIATFIYSALCIIAAVLLFYQQKLKKPLAELQAASEKIASNDLNFSLHYQSNDELGQLCSSFELMRSMLAKNFSEMWRQVEERKQLNAAFAHDLRTPLTVIKGYNEILQASENTTTRETADTMGKHIVRMESYISSMSHLRRLEDAQPDYKLTDLQPFLRIGDPIVFSIIDTDEQFQLPIGGQIPFDRDGMNSGAAPWLIVSNKVIDQYREDAIIYSIKIDSSSEHEESILRDVIELTSNIPAISRTSKIELAESLVEVKQALSGLSAFLTIVLFTIGILNFVNTMSMNILSRQREFAIMEAIGATKKQVYTIVTWEGLWYFILTLSLTFTVGSIFNYMIFNIVRENIGFGSFHYPLVPVLFYMVLLLWLCISIPKAIYKKLGSNSVVQRLV